MVRRATPKSGTNRPFLGAFVLPETGRGLRLPALFGGGVMRGGPNVYNLGKRCDCCGRSIPDRNASGSCAMCTRVLDAFAHHEARRIYALTEATPDWRECLRISEGVKL